MEEYTLPVLIGTVFVGGVGASIYNILHPLDDWSNDPSRLSGAGLGRQDTATDSLGGNGGGGGGVLGNFGQ